MSEKLVDRPQYLDSIRPFLDKPIIKVLTGMRRVGKSSLLRLISSSFEKNEGEERNLFFDMESLVHEGLRSYRRFYDRVKADLRGRKGRLFIDEVQEIEGWEKALSSLLAEDAADIYITGSNAKLLSGELATLLAGRSVTIPVWPLSLAEFATFRAAAGGVTPSPDELFDLYARYGGLPGIHRLDFDGPSVYQFLDAIYSAIVLKDVLTRTGARDINLLGRVAAYAFDNVGSILSSKRVSDYLRSDKRGSSVDTVASYLHALSEAFLILEAERFDIKGKRRLAMLEKYYAGDLGLRHAILGYRSGDLGGIAENLVFLELRRRGYKVWVGKLADLEIDFVAEGPRGIAYVQVAYLLESPDTVSRELAPFALLEDKYPCYLITLDRHFGGDLGGVRRLNLIDFLMGAEL
jgi:uncharacterized protein